MACDSHQVNWVLVPPPKLLEGLAYVSLGLSLGFGVISNLRMVGMPTKALGSFSMKFLACKPFA